MPEASSLLLRAYGNSPQMKILDYLLEFPRNDFTQKEIIEALGMSKTTFYKYFDNLLEFGMIRINRKIAKANLYSINLSNPIVQSMKNNVDYISAKIAKPVEDWLFPKMQAKQTAKITRLDKSDESKFRGNDKTQNIDRLLSKRVPGELAALVISSKIGFGKLFEQKGNVFILNE